MNRQIVDLTSAILVVALVTTIVIHPGASQSITAIGKIFSNSIKMFEGH